MMTKKELHLELDRLDLERMRQKEEFAQKVEDDQLAVLQVDVDLTDLDVPIIATKWTNRLNSASVFKHNLDLTNQEDANTHSFQAIYNRYVKGEPIPPGAIKNVQFDPTGVMSEGDLTDYILVDKYYTEKYGDNYHELLDKALQQNDDDDEPNDDDDEPNDDDANKMDNKDKADADFLRSKE